MGVVLKHTEQAMSDAQSITWQDIPITRVGPKRVSWSKNLLDIRNISPRVNTERFRFPAQPTQTGPSCTHFACKTGQPCRQAVSTISYTAALSYRKLYFKH